jgi:hypothetical protein
MPKKKSAVPITLEGVDFANDSLLLSDREINKQTGIWKRAQGQIGIPRSPETRAKISASLKLRRVKLAK